MKEGRRWGRIALITIGVIAVIMVGLALYVHSGHFHDLVRNKIVAQLEDATGGRVELKRFSWRLFQLEFVAEDLTIHGLEPPTEKPYAHIDHLKVRVKIISLLGREIGLNYVQASRPQLHIMVNADGSTNQPTPKITKRTGRSPLDQVFDLAIDRLEVSDGELLWNDRKVPLDFLASNVSVGMSFDAVKQLYLAEVSVGNAVAKYGKGKPLPMNAELVLELSRKDAEIKKLKLATPSSRLEASGRITNLQDPSVTLVYKVSADLAELARAAAMPEVERGLLDVEGSGTASANDFQSKGRLVLKNAAVHNDSVNVRDVTMASPFTLTKQKIVLPGIVGQLLGGTVKGSATVDQWLSASNARTEQQRGHAELTIAGIDVYRVAAATSSKSLPLQRLNAVGSTNGKAIVAWRGSPANAVADLDLTVTPPANLSAGQLPVSAKLQGTLNLATQSLEIRSGTFRTRGLQLQTTGGMGSESNELKVQLRATSLSELEPLLAAMGTSTRIPVELKGEASFNGTLRGKLTAPQLRGHLQVSNFDLLLASTGDKPKAPRRVHWDSLGVDVDYTRAAVSLQNGLLKRGTAQIAFAGGTTLHKGSFEEKSVFRASANITDAQLADVQSLAGYNYPVTGTLNARVSAQGTKTNMRGGAQLDVANGTIYGEPFKDFRADVALAGQDVQLRSASLRQNGATLTGQGAYNLQAKSFRLEAHGRNFDLAHIQKLQSPRLSLAGKGSFDMTAAGTVEQPTVQAKLSIQDMIANGEQIGDINAEAITRGRELHLTARSQLDKASLSVDGKAQLTGNFPGSMVVHFENLDFDPVLRAFLENRVTGHSSMSGRMEINGPFKQPKLLTVKGSIREISAQIEKITLTNSGPVEFTYANEVARLQRFHLRGEGTDIDATGTVSLADQKIDIDAKGDVNLKLVEGFYPDLMSYGSVNMALQIGGTIKKPVPVGTITIQNAGVSIIDLPNGLANINGTLVFNESRLQVQSLTAQTGGGTLKVGGYIAYQNGIFFDLTATGREIRLRYPPGISAAANADLRYTGTMKSSTLSGDVLVTRFGVNPRFDFALYLARGKNPPTAPKANPMLDNLRLDVHVTSTPELRVETQLAKISGDADLRIRGTVSRPAVLGRVNIAEGDIFFNSTKYHLERGDISFNNPVRIEPILNVEASARVREYDITLGFHGSVDKLNTTYRSEPPLPTADIIALLALGRTREDSVLNPPAQQNFAETASNAILGQALDAAVSSRVQKLFGVSRIKIDPQVGGPETATGARITIEQQVSNNVTLTYITNVARANQQIIQGEFNFTRDVSLVIVRDENGVLGFDVRVRQRKK